MSACKIKNYSHIIVRTSSAALFAATSVAGLSVIGSFVEPFVVASSEDRLVEFDVAKALYEQLDGAVLHDPKCGHVGMIAGSHAVENVWQPIGEWVMKSHA